MIFEPHHWAYAVLEALDEGKAPSNPKAAELYKAVTEDAPKHQALRKAWEYFLREDVRWQIDAFLLANALYTMTSNSLGIPVDVVQAYAEYIFDLSGLPNRIDRFCYVADIRPYIAPNNHLFLQTAITSGAEFLGWYHSVGIKGRVKYAPPEIMETLMIENTFKALSTRQSAITSDAAKEGLKYSQAALQAAAALQRLNPTDDQDALAELRLKLAHEDRTISAHTEGAPRPEDILH
jgi:hypothetical protein